MDILLVNQNWFADELRELGHNVVSYGRSDWLDVHDASAIVYWPDIKQSLPEGFNPSLVIFHDDSAALNIFGLEKIDIPTVFYSVDTHHHSKFHSQLGLFFSQIFVAQKDYLSCFSDIGVNASWLPLWASHYLEPSEEKEYDAVFVGTLDKTLNPDRVQFFEELQKCCAIKVMSGHFPAIFPKSKIVINQTVKSDLNFRVFETLVSGAMLITESSSNGLSDLFENGKHLVTYEKGNVQDAAEKIEYYLANSAERLKIAQAGRQELMTKHLAMNRVKYILNSLDKLSRPTAEPDCLGLVANFSVLGYSAYKASNHELAKAYYFEALRLTQLGSSNLANIKGDLPMYIMTALMGLRSYLSNQAIIEFIDSIHQRCPEQLTFKIAQIGLLAANGFTDQAHQTATCLNDQNSAYIVDKAELFINSFET